MGIPASRSGHPAILLRPPRRGEERRSVTGKSAAVLLVRRPPLVKPAVCATPPPPPPRLGGTVSLLFRRSWCSRSSWCSCLSLLLPSLSRLPRDMRLSSTSGQAPLERAPHPLLHALPEHRADGGRDASAHRGGGGEAGSGLCSLWREVEGEEADGTYSQGEEPHAKTCRQKSPKCNISFFSTILAHLAVEDQQCLRSVEAATKRFNHKTIFVQHFVPTGSVGGRGS